MTPPPSAGPLGPHHRRAARTRRSAAAVLAVATLVTGAAACGSSSSAASDSISTPLNGRNPKGLAGAGVQDPAPPKPMFTMADTSGAPFDFVAATRGDLTLLYFGYTHCPDVCPTFMAELGQAYKQLPAAVAAKVKVVFVTTDPDRDTGPVVRAWLDNFDKHFIGLVGTVDQTNQVLASMNLPPITKQTSAVGDYAVGHISEVLAFTSDDKAHAVFTEGVAVDRISHDLKLLAAGWSSSL